MGSVSSESWIGRVRSAPFSLGDNLRNYFEDREIDLNIYEEEVEKVRWCGNTLWETWTLYSFTTIRILGFFAFYVVGVFFYSYFEGWNRIDTIYFITQTVSTVGYGNIVPKTKSGKLFTVFYIFTGILLIFTVVGDLTRHFFVESIKRGYKKKAVKTRLQIVVRNFVNAGMWLCIIFALFVGGGMVFSFLEGIDFVDAFYFASYTATSVGYGDYTLTNVDSIFFNIGYILVTVALVAIGFEKMSNVKRHILEHENDQLMEAIKTNRQLLEAIARIIKPKNPDKISRSDYVLYMLMKSGKVDYSFDVKPWFVKFDELDLDRDQHLTLNDVNLHENLGDLMKKQAKQLKRNRTNQVMKKGILRRILCELRDIFLETIKVKKADEEFERIRFCSCWTSPSSSSLSTYQENHDEESKYPADSSGGERVLRRPSSPFVGRLALSPAPPSPSPTPSPTASDYHPATPSSSQGDMANPSMVVLQLPAKSPNSRPSQSAMNKSPIGLDVEKKMGEVVAGSNPMKTERKSPPSVHFQSAIGDKEERRAVANERLNSPVFHPARNPLMHTNMSLNDASGRSSPSNEVGKHIKRSRKL